MSRMIYPTADGAPTGPYPSGGFYAGPPMGQATMRRSVGALGALREHSAVVRVPSSGDLRGQVRRVTDTVPVDPTRSYEATRVRTLSREPRPLDPPAAVEPAPDPEKVALQTQCAELGDRVARLEQSLHAALARIAALELRSVGAPAEQPSREVLDRIAALEFSGAAGVAARAAENDTVAVRSEAPADGEATRLSRAAPPGRLEAWPAEEADPGGTSIEVAPRSVGMDRSEVEDSSLRESGSFALPSPGQRSQGARRGPAPATRKPKANLGPFHKPKLIANDRSPGRDRKARSLSPAGGRSASVSSAGAGRRTSGGKPGLPSRSQEATVSGAGPVREVHKGLAPGSALQTPDLSFVAHITWHDQLVSSATFMLDLVPDEEFLYLTTAALPPYTMDVSETAAREDLSAAFSGVTVVVFAINTATAKTTMVFKSHSSHVKKPPVSSSGSGGYFSHSCWLAGKGVNVVGGVRVFFEEVPSPSAPGSTALQIHRLSLKFWYPDSRMGQPFREPDLLRLLRLLGVLPEG